MADTPPIRSVIGLPPDETVRAFEARDELRTTVRWSEMWHDDHARAFTVAKVARLDILAELQASMADVIANGGTFEQWRDGIVPYLQKEGWWGEVADPALTGTADTITVGPRRLRTIYDTNLRMSRAAGRWTRIQALKGARPFLRYTAIMDARTRPEHRIWHGVILPVDHPWWDTHFPPCGWMCRCSVRQLSQRELDAKGWKVSNVPPEGPPRKFYPAGRTTPVMVPAGISPGFSYNPGKASMAAIADKATRSLEQAAAQDIALARATLDDLVQSEAFLETLSEPGAAFPVMILAPDLRAAIDARSAVVQLSSDTFSKQIGEIEGKLGHPELTIADYRRLPDIGASPDHVVTDKDRHLVFLRASNGKYLRATVKTTQSGQALFLVSFRWAEESEVRSTLARLKDLLA